MLIGRQSDLSPLLTASLKVTAMRYQPDTVIAEIDLQNTSDADFEARYNGPYSLGLSSDRFTIPAHSEITIEIKPGKIMTQIDLPLILENTLIEPNKHASMNLIAKLPL
jgi:hypothetical protein